MAWVQRLAGELRSLRPCGVVGKKRRNNHLKSEPKKKDINLAILFYKSWRMMPVVFFLFDGAARLLQTLDSLPALGKNNFKRYHF